MRTLIFLYFPLKRNGKGNIYTYFKMILKYIKSVEYIFFPLRIHRQFFSFFSTAKFTYASRTMTPYFPRRIARSLNDIPPSKSTAYDKDPSRKKPIRNISILPSFRGNSRAVAALAVLFFFFYLTIRCGTAFHARIASAGGQRNIEK